jgi:hypothetical protein
MAGYRDFETDPPEDADPGDMPEPPTTAEQELDDVAWTQEGKELAARETKTKWDIGAWLVKGKAHYPDFSDIPGAPPGLGFYTMAAEITGLAETTLKDIASTYTRAVSARTDACSWSHHRVLVNALETALPKADERTATEWLKKWLDRAAEEKLSVAALKEAVNAPIDTTVNLTRSFLVRVPLNVWELLKDLADYERSSVAKIASHWLVETAKEDGMQLQRKWAKQETKDRRREQRSKVGKRVARDYNPLRMER